MFRIEIFKRHAPNHKQIYQVLSIYHVYFSASLRTFGCETTAGGLLPGRDRGATPGAGRGKDPRRGAGAGQGDRTRGPGKPAKTVENVVKNVKINCHSCK